MARTVAPKRTGTVAPVTDRSGRIVGYTGRIHLGDDSRKRLRVPDEFAYNEKRAREWMTYAQEQEDIQGLHLKAKLAALAGDAPLHGAGAPEDATDGDKWFDAWEKSRKAKGLTSTRDNRSHYVHHIRPVLGGKHVREWTAEDVRGLVRAIDAKVQAGEMHWKYAVNVWATATKMASDAVRSKIDTLRVRTDNPCDDVEGPDRGAERTKQYLYPSEFLQFYTCEVVPIAWRRAVAQAIFVFPRDGEHRVLRQADLDLEHGVIHITRAWDRRAREVKSTKSKHTRRFNVEPNLVPLLRAIVEEQGEDPEALLAELPSERDMARGLRRWLKKAGVTRGALHTTTATTKAITWHDLRATGLTWMAVRGDEPLKIMQRAGHERFDTTQKYVREAEAIREGFGEVFPPLPPLVRKTKKRAPPSPVKPSSVSSSWTGLLDSGSQDDDILAGRTGLECAAEESTRETSEEAATSAATPTREPSAKPPTERQSRPAVQREIAPVQKGLDDDLRALAKRYIDAGEIAKAMALLATLEGAPAKPAGDTVSNTVPDTVLTNVVDAAARFKGR